MLIKPFTVKPVYKGHRMEPENVAFMSRLMGQMRLPFIDSDLLYRGDL